MCRRAGLVVAGVCGVSMCGCGFGTTGILVKGDAEMAAVRLTGVVFGGQQPISGAKVYLYAAGNGGVGSAAASALNAPGYVTTDGSGGFSLAHAVNCPSDAAQVYLLALGGDAGSGPNDSIGLMAGLGACGGLTSASVIRINEVTTVASVVALSAYMVDETHLGSAANDGNGLAAAFANIANLVDITTGATAPATAVGSGVVPQAAIYALANSLAACVNSSDGTACALLFGSTTVNGTVPTDTVQAAFNAMQNPTQHVADIFNIASSQPPFQPTLSAPPSAWVLQPSFPSDVLTYHNNAARTGVQAAETTLTPANVTSATFGKRLTLAVDGQLYAQLLYVGGYGMPDGAVHDLLLAATAHGTVYAFDADGNNPAQGYLWKQSLFAAGEAPVLASDYSCTDTTPESSLLGTPVIDRATGTLYAVSTEKAVADGTFTQKIHALSLLDGSETFNGPTVIGATYAGTGDGSDAGFETFDPLRQNQRAALLLSGGTVWIAWASHCDLGPYHGYVMGYSAADVSRRTVLFNNTPNGSDGGLWMAGGGPSADDQGYVYTIAGNGTFDATTGGSDYGDATLKMSAPVGGSTSPGIADYFVPYNQLDLSDRDQDVGVDDALLFNDPASGVAPRLLVETDKTGQVYLIDTANMGTYQTGPGGTNGDVQDFAANGPGSFNASYNNMAYFNGTLYIGISAAPVSAYAFVPGTSTTAGHFNTAPTSQSTTIPVQYASLGGAAPVVSANGTANGIVWTVDHTGVAPLLRAYDAADLGHELYNSGEQAVRDATPPAVKFISPVIANGQVFVGGSGAIAVYGLLP